MIFVDTWAWIALADRRDQYHQRAKAEHQRLFRAGYRYVTSDFILSETITYLYSALPTNYAQAFLQAVFSSVAVGVHQLIHISPEQFERTWQMRQRYADKPNISFVDFSSMIAMQDLGISEIFTGDAHFLHVGLGFQLVP